MLQFSKAPTLQHANTPTPQQAKRVTRQRSLSYLLAVLLGIVLALLLFTPLRFVALSGLGIPVSIRSVQQMPFVWGLFGVCQSEYLVSWAIAPV
ncbi:MAG: hypothetical protein SNJ57_00435 [Cyanobacteriota bacterium]